MAPLVHFAASSRDMTYRFFLSYEVRFMPHYRANHVDEYGRFRRVPHILLAETDQDAVAQAARLVNRFDIEVWQGERLVIKLKATVPKDTFITERAQPEGKALKALPNSAD